MVAGGFFYFMLSAFPEKYVAKGLQGCARMT
jgi:hypothetical protein